MRAIKENDKLKKKQVEEHKFDLQAEGKMLVIIQAERQTFKKNLG